VSSTGLSASLLVRLGIATSAKLGIATSASPTGSMLVVTDDLHPMGTYRTLFQLVPNLIPVGSG
jgi:K+-transporting ATPase A subunit